MCNFALKVVDRELWMSKWVTNFRLKHIEKAENEFAALFSLISLY